MKDYYITTAIAYTSGKPHIGNIYEIIFTDCIARYKRYLGNKVFFQTGTDEHGIKIEKTAKEQNKSPQEFVDSVAKVIKDLFDLADISYDKFIRTSDKGHKAVVEKIFEKLFKQGDIYKGNYEGYYCVPCETFLTESQLVDGKCPDCGREVTKSKEEAYFFKMSKYADRLVEYYNNNPEFILPVSRKTEMLNNFIKKGLQDLCVSRTSFTWGVNIGFDPKHVVYVWLDALVNYITGIGYNLDNSTEQFKALWPADLHVIGKDIVRFHVIYWPIFLMALDLPLPKQIYGHGWLLQNGEKMSKSKGNVIYFDDLANLFGVDATRYYVLSEMGFENDGLIGWDLLTEKLNTELSNIYGNLVSRTIAMANKYFNGKVSAPTLETSFDADLKTVVKNCTTEFLNKFEDLKVADGIAHLSTMFKRANKYIDETAPWILAKDAEKQNELNTVLYNLLEVIKIGTSLISFVMPSTAKTVFDLLNTNIVEHKDIFNFGASKGFDVKNESAVLFKRKEIKEVMEFAEKVKEEQLKEFNKNADPEKPKKQFVDFDTFLKTELKVGTILDSVEVEGSDKLLKNTVKIGDEVRTIVSGIKQTYKPSEIIGKQVVVVTNLAPRKIKGIESAGMILCAFNDEENQLALVSPITNIKDGSEVS